MYRAKSKSLFLIGFLLLSIQTIAQTGKLEGVITDKNTKETLVGANVIIVGTTIGALADLDGHYVIDNIKPGTYNIQLSFISYKPLVLEGIKIEAGKTTQLNTELEEVSVTLGNVEVVAVKRGGTEISMINAIKANQLVASGISSQQIQRSQDRDASEVVKRVPGITIIDDRFIVVRGLNQRYNNVWLNNAATPSSETDVKAFSFDAIPSSMIENLMIYKSSAPEIPADFSGGFIKIFTKNMPDENTYSIGYSTSFSPGTTFSDFYRFGSKNDNWTGFDNKRELPSYFPSNLQNVSANDQVELSKRLDNTWTPSLKTALPDQRVNFSMSHRMKLGNNTLGEITSLGYTHTNDYNSVVNRNYGVYNFELDKPSPSFDFTDDVYTESTRIGIMNNWSLLLGKGHKIELRNLYNHQGKYKTSIREGLEYGSGTGVPIKSMENGFVGRDTYSGQISGSHTFREGNTKIDWVAGYSLADRKDPDLKRVKQTLDDNETSPYYNQYGLIIPTSPLSSSAGRLFMDMHEDLLSFGVNFEHKLSFNNLKPTIKAGVYAEDKTRNFNARKLGYIYSDLSQRDFAIQYLPVDQLLSGSYFNSTTGIKLSEETSKSDSYDAGNRQLAGYVALNIPVSKKINVYVGARAEKNSQNINSYDRYQQPIEVVNDTLDIFPSANISYNFNEKNLIRLAYGKSINRPEFREIAPFPFYDFENNALFSGNPDVKNAYIHNFDLRYELYPSQFETFSLGVFYKRFINPIELKYAQTGSGLEYSYQNADRATNYGIELELRKSLAKSGSLKNWSAVLNGAWIKSNITFKNNITDLERPLAGQSPYVVNAGLYYDDVEKSRLMISVLYNVIGKRIHIVGIPAQNSWESMPDVYEMPRHLVDLTISKKIGKYFEIKGGIKDLLNQAVIYKQTIDENVDLSYYSSTEPQVKHFKVDQTTRKYKPGTYYTIGFQVKF